MFIPNQNAVEEAVEKLLSKQAGGGKPTLDDACWIAFDNIHNSTSCNEAKFWRAVYDQLHAKRTL